MKTGQRQSSTWKTAWQSYCAVYGSGRNDPAKYDDSFIRAFIDYVGDLAAEGLAGLAAQQGIDIENPAPPVSGSKRPHGGGQPPAKRQATAPSYDSYDQVEIEDSSKAALVDRVKALQRSDPEAKQAWWQYCDSSAKGVRDPNRHEIASLEEFLASFD